MFDRGLLRDLQESTVFAILHPNYKHHRDVLWQLTDGFTTHYLRFQQTNLSFTQLLEQYTQVIDELDDSERVPVEFVILDECDRADQTEFALFLKHLALNRTGMGSSTRVIILGRVVPYEVIVDPQLRSMTQVFPNVPDQMMLNYDRLNENRVLLEVQALGTGYVRLNGKPILDWDGYLPRSLFFFLVDQGMVTRERIFETFWENMSVSDATNVFHVTKRKVNEILGIDLMTYSGGFYRLSPDIDLVYDVSLLNQQVLDSAMVSPDEEVRMLEKALEIYRGDFLNGLDFEWVNQRREMIKQTMLDALITLGEIKIQQNRFDEAYSYFLRATTIGLHREDIVRHVLQLSMQLQVPCEGIQAYDRLVHILEQTLNVTPTDDLIELADQARVEC